jgi:hypothetical protein
MATSASDLQGDGRYSLAWNALTLSHSSYGGVVVEALCYKPEGRGFETR